MPGTIRTILALLISVAGLSALAGEKPPTGNSSTILYQRATGEAPFAGCQIKYIVALTKSPSHDGGSLIAFFPPIDVERGPDGKVKAVVGDPDRGGDFLLARGSTRLPAGAEEVARAVQAGDLAPDTPVALSLAFRLHASPQLKMAVLEAAQVQLARDVIKREHSLTPMMSGDVEKLQKSVIMLPMQTFTIRCTSPGLENVRFEMKNNPTLRETLRFQAVVPARFVSQLYSKQGAQFEAEALYEAFAETYTTLRLERVCNDFVEQFIDGQGKGGLHYDKGKGSRGDIEILCNRELTENYRRSSHWHEKLAIRGSSLEEINLLVGLFRQGDTDIFAVQEKQVVDDFNRNIETVKKIVNEPGFATTLEEALKKDEWTDQETEKYRSLLETFNKNAQGGGGFSLFGVVSLGGGGGSSEAGGKADKEQERRALRAFFSDLLATRKEGKFPVHPSMKFSVVSKAKLQRRLEDTRQISRAGEVRTFPLMATFDSADPILPPAAPAEDYQGLQKSLEKREDLQKKLNELRDKLKDR